jgi:hypothetical protein
MLLGSTADLGRLYLTNRRLFFRRYADTSPWVQLVTGLFASGFFVVIAFSDATAVVPGSLAADADRPAHGRYHSHLVGIQLSDLCPANPFTGTQSI